MDVDCNVFIIKVIYIYHFGFEDGIPVLFVSVPCHFISVTSHK